MERVRDPRETVELTIEGRGLALGVGLLACSAWLAVVAAAPWRWLFMALPFAIVVSTLREARWSPYFAGPILTLTPSHITGRGGILQPAWALSWGEVDRFSWGRYGLFVYRKGAATWQGPCMQGGIGGPRLVAALSARLAAYRRDREEADGGVAERAPVKPGD